MPACAEAFSTAETAPKGRYLAGPVTWGGFDEERVEALGLPFEVIHAGTDAALFAELESAYQRQAPIMLWIYAPHWAVAKYKGEWVEFPEYEPACYTDPSWGVNKDLAYDCGKPHGEIWKVGWAGVKDKWPKAYAAIKAFTIDNDEMGADDHRGRSERQDRRRGRRRPGWTPTKAAGKPGSASDRRRAPVAGAQFRAVPGRRGPAPGYLSATSAMQPMAASGLIGSPAAAG